MNPQIKEIDYGIAFCVKDKNKKWIEVNRNLKNYPRLYKRTILHEKQHLKSKNKHIDFLIDFKDLFNLKNQWDIFNFTFHHPKSLLANSPILYENKKWSVNWFMVILNLFFIGMIIGGIILL